MSIKVFGARSEAYKILVWINCELIYSLTLLNMKLQFA
jgi:hypothetical protein